MSIRRSEFVGKRFAAAFEILLDDVQTLTRVPDIFYQVERSSHNKAQHHGTVYAFRGGGYEVLKREHFAVLVFHGFQ